MPRAQHIQNEKQDLSVFSVLPPSLLCDAIHPSSLHFKIILTLIAGSKSKLKSFNGRKPLDLERNDFFDTHTECGKGIYLRFLLQSKCGRSNCCQPFSLLPVLSTVTLLEKAFFQESGEKTCPFCPSWVIPEQGKELPVHSIDGPCLDNWMFAVQSLWERTLILSRGLWAALMLPVTSSVSWKQISVRKVITELFNPSPYVSIVSRYQLGRAACLCKPHLKKKGADRI